MLARPGQSPRLIQDTQSEETPGRHQLALSSSSSSIQAENLERPLKRFRTPVVLDEDTYVAAIEKIVERDFFPDIPKLQNRLEWLEAVRSGDPVKIRDAQVRIIQRKSEVARRSDGTTPSVAGTPATVFGTPASALVGMSPFGAHALGGSVLRADGGGKAPFAGGNLEGFGAGVEAEKGLQGTAPDIALSLDEFVMRYTSEDNFSFSQIRESDNRKRLLKSAHLLQLEHQIHHEKEKERLKLAGPEQLKAIEAASGEKLLVGEGSKVPLVITDGKVEGRADPDRKTDGFGSTGQPVSTLVGWDYCPRNPLMYDSSTMDPVPLSAKEKEQLSMGPPKEVRRRNTRFQGKFPAHEGQAAGRQGDTVAVLYTPLAGGTPRPFREREGQRTRYDLEDLTKAPGAGDWENEETATGEGGKAYGYVATPSPAPGAGGESPFMTWGDIEGTPVRLDAEETPVDIGGKGSGPHFTIAKATARDDVAVRMSRDAARNLKQRRDKYPGSSSPYLAPSPVSSVRATPSPSVFASPARGGAAGGAGLSSAAQKLVNRALSNRRVDSSLRASYQGGASPALHKHTLREGSVPLRSPIASPLVASKGMGGSHRMEGSPAHQN